MDAMMALSLDKWFQGMFKDDMGSKFVEIMGYGHVGDERSLFL